MGIAVLEGSRQLYHFQKLGSLSIYLILFNQAKILQGLGEDILHQHFRIKGCCRVLEDHLDFATVLTGFLAPILKQIMAFKNGLTAGSRLNLQQRAHQGALTTAGFANDAQGFALIGTQGNIIAGRQQSAVIHLKLLGQVLNI